MMSTTKKLEIKNFPYLYKGLNSSLAQLVGELQSCKVMVKKCLTWVLKLNPTSSEGGNSNSCSCASEFEMIISLITD